MLSGWLIGGDVTQPGLLDTVPSCLAQQNSKHRLLLRWIEHNWVIQDLVYFLNPNIGDITHLINIWRCYGCFCLLDSIPNHSNEIHLYTHICVYIYTFYIASIVNNHFSFSFFHLAKNNYLESGCQLWLSLSLPGYIRFI